MPKLKPLLALALTCAYFSACTVEQTEIPPDELYAREFIKQFGVIAPNHDCNMATRGTVTVIASKPTDLKVLADIKGKRYIFADYRKVNGTQKITFDIPHNVKDVIIRENNREHTLALNSTLNLSSTGSRTVNDNRDDSPVAYWPEDMVSFNAQIPTRFYLSMPRNNSKNYQNALTTDFYFISEADKEMAFYPVGGKNIIENKSSNKTYYSHCLGIYWLDDNGLFKKENMRDIYYGYTGETVLVKDNGNEYNDYFLMVNTNYPTLDDLYEVYRPYSLNLRKIKYKFNQSGIKYGFYLKVYSLGSDKPKSDELYKILVPGPNDTKPKDFNYLHFTQSSINKTFGDDPDNKWIETQNGLSPGRQSLVRNLSWTNVPAEYTHVTACFKPIEYETGETRLFFAFEDGQNNNEFDLCDIAFMFDESSIPILYDETSEAEVSLPGHNQSTPEPEYEPYEWLIAAEDLGGVNDFDFNDLVLSVKYSTVKDGSTQEYTDVTITPLAAGGTLPIYLMYDGTLGTDPAPSTYVIGEECHSWLGGSDHTTPLNVHGSITHICDESKAVTIRVPGTFSLAAHSDNAVWNSENMGGFWLLTDPKEQFNPTPGPYAIAGNIPESTHKVQPPKQGEEFTSPQMICVGTEWEWTTEGSSINDTYYNFTQWLNSSAGDIVEWYGSPDHHNNNVVPRNR